LFLGVKCLTNGVPRAGLCAGVALEFRLLKPLLIENMLMKLKTKVDSFRLLELKLGFAIG